MFETAWHTRQFMNGHRTRLTTARAKNHGWKHEAGTDRPNLESAWRIEGDLQLMIASFAGTEKLKRNSAGHR